MSQTKHIWEPDGASRPRTWDPRMLTSWPVRTEGNGDIVRDNSGHHDSLRPALRTDPGVLPSTLELCLILPSP